MVLIVRNYQEVEEEETNFEGVKIRWLIVPKMGAKNFAMRYFSMAPNSTIPEHSHDWEHEIFVLRGRGIITGEGKEHEVKDGDVVYIPPTEVHGYRALNEGLEFLCLIPAKKEAIPEDKWS